MSLSKRQQKKHNEAVQMAMDATEPLSHEDRLFIFENYHPGGTNLNGLAGAFFTPWSIAWNLVFCVRNDFKVVDVCAGIGILGYAIWFNDKTCWDESPPIEITCIEFNPEYVEIGKKVFPEAKWILADALDPATWENLGPFTTVVSNPPFGKVKTGHANKYNYTGSEFEYRLLDTVSKIAEWGAFVLPHESIPFRYSRYPGVRYLGMETIPEKDYNKKLKKFTDQTGIIFEFNSGLDCSMAEWASISPAPRVELVTCDFTEIIEDDRAKKAVRLAEIKPKDRFMDPYAGNGNILRSLPKCDFVEGVEGDEKLARKLNDEGLSVLVRDLLDWSPGRTFDKIVTHIPFKDQCRHIWKVYSLLNPYGRLVGIVRPDWMEGDDKDRSSMRKWLKAVKAEYIPIDHKYGYLIINKTDKDIAAYDLSEVQLYPIEKPSQLSLF